MQFSRLRLSGFKSFVEATELYIEPGLTGIVGPNGCGKSNLIEALRWVMGENSPKSMRGGGMDDVIFAGTALRPARNLAEVTLLLDNSGRRAPAGHNDTDELEISRRIERDSGSAYRINGREVRARDVQLLFADAATGSHSSSMVSQGRIGALISAKPQERRAILEEAAGITGLHSRRHEAELRLRAAENNLVRLHDVMDQIEGQLHSLRRQARQAKRYSSLSARIRQSEALLAHVRWLAATAAVEAGRRDVHQADLAVNAATERAASAAVAQAEAASVLPRLRESEAEKAAALQRLIVARENLDVEEKRARDTLAGLSGRQEQIDRDLHREKALIDDSREALTSLTDERARLTAEEENETANRQAAEAALAAARTVAEEADATLDGLNQQLAGETARRASLVGDIAEATERLARIDTDLGKIDTTLAELQAGVQNKEAPDPTPATDAVDLPAAVGQVEKARAAIEETGRQTATAREAEALARDALNAAETEAARLNAEATTLADILAAAGHEDFSPVIDEVTAAPGYEAALAAALGDDLGLPLDAGAPAHWGSAVAVPAQRLPGALESLADHVSAPAALAARLSQIGLVDEDRGAGLQAALLPGQRLVSTGGALWRWDGLVVGAGAGGGAAARLEQRNRLKALWAQLAGADSRLEEARREFEMARLAAQNAAESEVRRRRQWQQAENALSSLREQRRAAERAADQKASRIETLSASRERLLRDRHEVQRRLVENRATHDGLAPEERLRAAVEAARCEAAGCRRQVIDKRATFDDLLRNATVRQQRLGRIDEEKKAWTLRIASAEGQLKDLALRATEVRAAHEKMAGRPAEIEELRRGLLDHIAGAEKARNAAADDLAGAEGRLAVLDRRLKEAEAALSGAREQRIRIDAGLEQATARLADIEARVAEELDCAPPALGALAGLDGDGEDLPEADVIAAKLERARRERDNIGPVNLRAELEAGELEQQLEVMNSEQQDLEAAIARLRHAIGGLNREGRERLRGAFDTVSSHFGTLFGELFGGGKAHLRLVDSDDPLEAGLEILASPPGKKLQRMSLLSGGEQALTALALIFAVFLTNPSPICVLDEVDAPLDDANVGRMCDLMRRITAETGTRFLIVTHHPLTMSRVDTLFGVTMGERGVSQLVSVELGEADRLQAVG